MKSSLQEIDILVRKAIAREKKSPTISAAEAQVIENFRFRIVVGVIIEDTAAKAAKLEEYKTNRRNKILAYCSDSDALIKRLDELDITPCAMMPRRAWERICKESNLLQLVPSYYGRFGISTRIARSFEEEAKSYFKALHRVLVITIGCLSSVAMSFHGSKLWHATAIGIMVALIIQAIVFCRYWWYSENGEWVPGITNLIKPLVRKKVKNFTMQPWPYIVKILFPGGGSIAGNCKTHVTFVIPPAPENIKEVLYKARSFSLCVAMMPEAISFLEPLEDVLLQGSGSQGPGDMDTLLKRVEEEESRQEKNTRGQIIYIEHGSAIALLAQFGDFPLEKETIERILRSDALI